jgi:hypothetical protein
MTIRRKTAFNLDAEQAALVINAMKGERRAILDQISMRPFPDAHKTKLQNKLKKYENLIQYFDEKTAEKVERLITSIASYGK